MALMIAYMSVIPVSAPELGEQRRSIRLTLRPDSCAITAKVGVAARHKRR